jgi:hypothetical protein
MRRNVLCWVMLASCGGLPAQVAAPTDSSVAQGFDASAGKAGPAGPPGPEGPAGSPGAPPPYHWVDSTGLAVTTGVELVWIDPATGWWWGVDAETGLVESVVVGEETIVYTDSSCSSGDRVRAVAPDVPFRHEGSGNEYVVRPRNLVGDPTCGGSVMLGLQCFALACIEGVFIATRDLVETGFASAPASPWVGPLHLER